MARSRNIKPGFFKNEILGEADPIYALLFAGLWTLADKEGRLEYRPKRIKAELFPYRDDVDVSMALAWLKHESFITQYCVKHDSGEKTYIQIVNWRKHQTPHHKEADSEIPSEREAIEINKKQEVAHAQAKHDSSMTQACVKHNASCPTDSLNLIPDSLNPIPKHDPPDGGPPPSEDGKPWNGKFSNEVGLKRFLDECDAQGVLPIPDDDPIFAYSDGAQVPHEFLQLCWREFEERYLARNKRYKDWRAVFRNAVRGNWFKLWYIDDGNGAYALTTAGKQAKLRHQQPRAAHA